MIDKNDILQKAEKLVYDKLHAEASGHDWWHAVRVRNTARELAEKEGADSFICQLTALVHDIADEKLNDDPKQALADLKAWLIDQQLSQTDVDHIIQIINTMSFKGDGSSVPVTLEGKIVQDADRLDAVGAIDIARCWLIQVARGVRFMTPMTAREHLTAEEYRNGKDTAILHFYEKLLKLKDLMNTSHARKMAEHRHAVLEGFLKEFYAEWDGKL